jgi:hypothetical protein
VSTLSNAELNALAATYRRPIRHGINNDPNANASAFVNENQVFVNFGNLFPDGDAEIAQTLIHEMMHCTGFSHPTRRNPDPALGQSCAAPNPPFSIVPLTTASITELSHCKLNFASLVPKAICCYEQWTKLQTRGVSSTKRARPQFTGPSNFALERTPYSVRFAPASGARPGCG